MLKLPGQTQNLCHSSDPSHGSDNAGSLSHWATRELLLFFFVCLFEISFNVELGWSQWWNEDPGSCSPRGGNELGNLTYRNQSRSRQIKRIQGGRKKRDQEKPTWGDSPFVPLHQKQEGIGVLSVAQQKPIRLGTMRLWVQSLDSLNELRIRSCHELWCRLQLGHSRCHEWGPESQKKKKNLWPYKILHIEALS